MNTEFKISTRILFFAGFILAFNFTAVLACDSSCTERNIHETSRIFAAVLPDSDVETDIVMEAWMNDVSYWNSWSAGIRENDIAVSSWMANLNYWSTGRMPVAFPETADESELGMEEWMSDPCRWETGRMLTNENQSRMEKLCINTPLNDGSSSTKDG
jgi:hypothetical protein